MSTMRAAVLRGWNDLAVEEVDVPQPGPGEVQLRVRACGLCGTDLKMVQGEFQQRGWPPSLPFVMGHEWSGEVVAIGEGLDDLQLEAGDKVVAENHVGCGRCPMCRLGRYNLCEKSGTPGYRLYGHTAPGALAEYAVRPAQMLHKLPDSVSPLEGALVNQGAMTVHALRRVEFLPGSTVAIFGPGLLGLLSAAVASASGASQIIMVGRGNRLDLATKMGCDEVVDYEDEDPVAGVRRLSAGRGSGLCLRLHRQPGGAGAGTRCGATGRPGGHPRSDRRKALRDRRRPSHSRRDRSHGDSLQPERLPGDDRSDAVGQGRSEPSGHPRLSPRGGRGSAGCPRIPASGSTDRGDVKWHW